MDKWDKFPDYFSYELCVKMRGDLFESQKKNLLPEIRHEIFAGVSNALERHAPSYVVRFDASVCAKIRVIIGKELLERFRGHLEGNIQDSDPCLAWIPHWAEVRDNSNFEIFSAYNILLT